MVATTFFSRIFLNSKEEEDPRVVIEGHFCSFAFALIAQIMLAASRTFFRTRRSSCQKHAGRVIINNQNLFQISFQLKKTFCQFERNASSWAEKAIQNEKLNNFYVLQEI